MLEFELLLFLFDLKEGLYLIPPFWLNGVIYMPGSVLKCMYFWVFWCNKIIRRHVLQINCPKLFESHTKKKLENLRTSIKHQGIFSATIMNEHIIILFCFKNESTKITIHKKYALNHKVLFKFIKTSSISLLLELFIKGVDIDFPTFFVIFFKFMLTWTHNSQVAYQFHFESVAQLPNASNHIHDDITHPGYFVHP